MPYSRTRRALTGLTMLLAVGGLAPAASARATGNGPGNAGATLPFVELEAEQASTNGTVIGPDRAFTHLAAEASGRRAVRLDGVGRYVQFRLTRPANAIDIRYAIPDSTDGAGLIAGLNLYLNGRRTTTLSLTSKYSAVYGNYPFTNNPADGDAHHYFDDVRTMFGSTLPAGATVRLQVDPGNTAPWYVVDVADFELVAPPVSQPAGFGAVTEFGADPTGQGDATGAFQAAIDAGQAEHVGVFIPPGTFAVTGQLRVDNVTLRGAGPWYSVLSGAGVGVFGHAAPTPSSAVHLADFAIFGDTWVRNDSVADSGLGGSLGGGSTVDNLWIEHTKVGAWFDGPSDGLTIKRLRIQNVMADGINLHNGVSHTTVSDTFVRNSGDDGMAMWSDQNADHDDAFSHNTVIAPVLANAFAIYGGHDNAITDNIGADTVTQGGGAHVGNRFGSVPIAGTTTIAGNRFVRTGNLVPNFPTTDSAIWLWAADSPMTGHVDIIDNAVLDSPYAALQFVGSSITNVRVHNLLIAGAGTFAVQLQATGSADISNVVATRLGSAGVYDCASGFTLHRTGVNLGWSTTRCGFPPLGQLEVSPGSGSLAFGDQALNTQATKTVTVANPGPGDIIVNRVSGPDGYTIANHCTTIPVHGSCLIDVTFAPATANLFTGLLTIDSTSPAGPYLVALSGLGFDPDGNLALGHPITSSSRAADFFGPAKANDGNQDTYFESQNGAFPQTLTVDLTAVRDISRVVLQLPANWGARTETVEILGSTDGTTFSRIVAPHRRHARSGRGQHGHHRVRLDAGAVRAACRHRQHRLAGGSVLRVPGIRTLIATHMARGEEPLAPLPGPPVPAAQVRSQTAVSGGSRPSVSGPLASSTAACSMRGTGVSERFATQANPGSRRKASTSCGAVWVQVMVPSPRAGSARRMRRADR
jgi:Pectate lyase superfamily protein/F5/8 type C domain/Abnormal spindle-like microcephaly-assoc'd, ASPM-SPD-2-Hydin